MASSRARICLIAPEFIGPFPNGGVGTACYWEASVLAEAGYDVTVLYTGPTERATAAHWEQTYAAGPFTYVDLWRWAGAAAVLDDVEQPCAEARTAEMVLRFLRAHPFDLLLFQEFLGHGARALQARHSGETLGGAAAVTLHSCRQWIYEGMRRLPSSREDLSVDFLERESARLADAVVAPSRHMAGWAETHWRLETPPAVVPYCYDPRASRPAGVITHRGPFKHLVFFGRLETRKGLHLFCRALAENPAARGSVTQVTFLGKVATVEGRPSDEFIRTALAPLQGVDVRILSTLGSMEALEWLEQQPEALVVAPSLVDNLPYALIELFSRRVPFVSTRIGGIPEIVGAANIHALADPTAADLGRLLADVQRAGTLTIDYGDGYDVARANAAHLQWVGLLLDGVRASHAAPRRCSSLVFVDADRDSLDTARTAFVAADSTAEGVRAYTWADWRESHDAGPALFVSTGVTPQAGMTRRLMRALAQRHVSAATSYYERQTESSAAAVAPLGASLEAGWMLNVFGGPSLAAEGRGLSVLRRACHGAFAFWPAYAALACAELNLALVPEVLYQTAPVHDEVGEVEAVAETYRRGAPARFDLGWVLKYATAREGAFAGPRRRRPADAGRALYDHLLAIPDEPLQAFAGLTWTPAEDPFVRDMRHLRTRLAALVREWRDSHPRIFVYGAGQHARIMLALEPELGRFVAGFVDRRPIAEFLGKPCVRPEQFSPAVADVLLYSSREHERDMYARMATLDVRHVLLYADPPAPVPDDTSARLRRRLGQSSDAVDALRAMYRPPAWVQGGCSGGDVEFLLALVAATDPQTVLELGVASGTSSAALLFALDQQRALSRDRLLFSGDVRATCYFDASRPTGAAVDEMYPQRRTPWALDTDTDARRVRQTFAPQSVDLCFIDANHCHPWPLLDLLHVATLMRPGAWIALHDIELPRLHPQFQVHGPQWLFEAWPFNKIHGVEGSVNIGAVQLPPDVRHLVPMALSLLERRWEHAPTAWDVDLPPIFDEISRALTPRLAQPGLAARAG